MNEVVTKGKEGAGMRSIKCADLPLGILQHQYDFSQEDIAQAFVVDAGTSEKTYGIEMKPGRTVGLLLLVDYSDGIETGYVRLDELDGTIFARNIATYEGYERRGLAEQRLKLANAWAQSRFQKPLHSGLATLRDGRNLWKHLIREGLVIPTGNVTNHMYRFKIGGE